MHFSWPRAAVVSLVALAAVSIIAQATTYTVLSREGRRPLPYRAQGGQHMVALDDLASLFGLTVREDVAAGGIIVTAPGGATIVLTPGQPLASAGGRVVSLPAAPARDGRAWLVPVEFASRAIGPVLGSRIDVRKGTQLIVVGNLRVPEVTIAVEGGADRARVLVDASPATPVSVTQEGRRLIVRFEADALDLRAPTNLPGDLITAVTASDAPQNVIVDLGPRAGQLRTVPAPPGGGRAVIEIAAQGVPLAPTEPAQPTEPAPEPPPLPDFGASAGLRTIVIDPGHGGDEAGARGPGGTLEKDVALAIGRRIKASLEARLGVRVLLTREGDQTMSVDQRTSLANNNKADLFVSVHANAAPAPGPSGAEVFSLAREGYGTPAGGTTARLPVFGGGTRTLDIIPWDTAQIPWLPDSSRLAGLVHAELSARVPMNQHALDTAPFRVLIGANMPAVLVETGFLTNPAQEGALAGSDFQNDIAQAIVTAIVRYRDGETAAPVTGAGTPAPDGDDR